MAIHEVIKPFYLLGRICWLYHRHHETTTGMKPSKVSQLNASDFNISLRLYGHVYGTLIMLFPHFALYTFLASSSSAGAHPKWHFIPREIRRRLGIPILRAFSAIQSHRGTWQIFAPSSMRYTFPLQSHRKWYVQISLSIVFAVDWVVHGAVIFGTCFESYSHELRLKGHCTRWWRASHVVRPRWCLLFVSELFHLL